MSDEKSTFSMLRMIPLFRTIHTKFEFTHVLASEVGKQINEPNINKAKSCKIPTDILRKTKDMSLPDLTDCINSAIYEFKFPKELKTAHISPCFKRGITNAKVKYRPISV